MQLIINNKNINIDISVMSISIPLKNLLIEETLNNNIINSITINNSKTYSVNDKVEVIIKDDKEFKTYYKINEITKNNYNYLLNEFKFEISSYFLIPSIMTNIGSKIFNAYFCGCYTEIENTEFIPKDGLLYCVYRFTPFKSFEINDSYLCKLPNYISKTDYDRFRIYTFKQNTQDIDVVKEFLNTSIINNKKYSDKIISYLGLSKEHRIYKYLNNSRLKREEIAEFFNMDIKDVPENAVWTLEKNKINLNSTIWKL